MVIQGKERLSSHSPGARLCPWASLISQGQTAHKSLGPCGLGPEIGSSHSHSEGQAVPVPQGTGSAEVEGVSTGLAVTCPSPGSCYHVQRAPE